MHTTFYITAVLFIIVLSVLFDKHFMHLIKISEFSRLYVSEIYGQFSNV